MEELATAGAIAALLVGIHAVFAVFLYRVLSSERDNTEASPEAVRMGSTAAEDPPAVDARPDSGRGGERPAVPCPVCGTPNDPSFRFCRQCVSDLSGGAMSVGGADDGSDG
jgi:hypothetical protein